MAEFLHRLLRHLHGHVVLLWERTLIHKGRPVRDLLSRYARLHVEWFPGYAPELNPVEYMWTKTKRRLATSPPEGAEELRAMVDSATISRFDARNAYLGLVF